MLIIGILFIIFIIISIFICLACCKAASFYDEQMDNYWIQKALEEQNNNKDTNND